MKKSNIFAMLFVVLVSLSVGLCFAGNDTRKCEEQWDEVNLMEFEMIRTQLYDCAMTICTGLSECKGSCFYEVSAQPIEIFQTYRVPHLDVLLSILDEIDETTTIYDVYDDDEGTAFKYYELRRAYERYF